MRLALLLTAALLASACTSVRARSRPEPRAEPSDGEGGLAEMPVGVAEASADCKARYRKGTLEVPKDQLEGIASFYGKQHHGRQTASGEIFDMNKYSAAHRTLLLGVKVRVTNLDNGRSIDVCINDRGPYAKDRILDLSYAAAKELGLVAEGTAPVRITILGQ